MLRQKGCSVVFSLNAKIIDTDGVNLCGFDGVWVLISSGEKWMKKNVHNRNISERYPIPAMFGLCMNVGAPPMPDENGPEPSIFNIYIINLQSLANGSGAERER